MRRPSLIVWAAFALLCVLLGSDWLVRGSVAEGAGADLAALSALAFLTLLAGPFVRFEGGDLRGVVGVAGAGMLVVGVPGVVLRWCAAGVPSLARAGLLSLVPVMTVVAWSAVEGVGELRPALVGAAGALLLLPADLGALYQRPLEVLAVLGAGAAVALGAVVGYRVCRPFRPATAVVAMAAPLLVLGLVETAWSGSYKGVSLGAVAKAWPLVLVDGTELTLVLLLIRELDPVRYSTRFLLVPLVTAAEGIALMRPEVSVRQGIGAVLMVVGAIALIRGPRTEGSGGLSLG